MTLYVDPIAICQAAMLETTVNADISLLKSDHYSGFEDPGDLLISDQTSISTYHTAFTSQYPLGGQSLAPGKLKTGRSYRPTIHQPTGFDQPDIPLLFDEPGIYPTVRLEDLRIDRHLIDFKDVKPRSWVTAVRVRCIGEY